MGLFHTVIIDLNDNVWIFGYNHFGQLGLDDNERISEPKLKAKQICTGDRHTIVIDLDNNIIVFGSNKHEQLGLNISEEFINVPTQIPGIKIKQISSNHSSSAMVTI
jgi:alpha-tubulin suppressor-like RCC1 family protein